MPKKGVYFINENLQVLQILVQDTEEVSHLWKWLESTASLFVHNSDVL